MAFMAETLKALMDKGLTRKEARKVLTDRVPPAGTSRHKGIAGMSRQVVRKIKREGQLRLPTYSNGWKVLNHKKGHRLPIPKPHTTYIDPATLLVTNFTWG